MVQTEKFQKFLFLKYEIQLGLKFAPGRKGINKLNLYTKSTLGEKIHSLLKVQDQILMNVFMM